MPMRVAMSVLMSEEFEVKVGVHQGSVLSPLLHHCANEAL